MISNDPSAGVEGTGMEKSAKALLLTAALICAGVWTAAVTVQNDHAAAGNPHKERTEIQLKKPSLVQMLNRFPADAETSDIIPDESALSFSESTVLDPEAFRKGEGISIDALLGAAEPPNVSDR
ncbi:hypothetical protein [Alteribacter natronophilus]|uniref:hypothetical protein n=1 Tax=Alteribacter natronophilus TaxID=2583810 RepID=UPI00110F5F56|nr:hypothetical protein [Alteribacter natronophilus]TMW73531.1 hypothetical protein FGB90_04320 [Alteribacter natronophilus]